MLVSSLLGKKRTFLIVLNMGTWCNSSLLNFGGWLGWGRIDNLLLSD